MTIFKRKKMSRAGYPFADRINKSAEGMMSSLPGGNKCAYITAIIAAIILCLWIFLRTY